jgi:hypothetical protein
VSASTTERTDLFWVSFWLVLLIAAGTALNARAIAEIARRFF